MEQAARQERLDGYTFKVSIDEDNKYYLIINEQNGEPFEVFIRSDDPAIYQWVNACTVLITRMLRAGISLSVIAGELQEIHSAGTSLHFTPNGKQCHSIVARIGQVFEQYLKQRGEAAA